MVLPLPPSIPFSFESAVVGPRAASIVPVDITATVCSVGDGGGSIEGARVELRPVVSKLIAGLTVGLVAGLAVVAIELSAGVDDGAVPTVAVAAVGAPD